jgi:MinD superfamily P-loop ATPase
MILSVASGKGGTGKTTIAVNLALSLPKGNVQLIDCDVEEPDSHLFLSPSIHQVTSMGIPVPELINPNALTVVNLQSASPVPLKMQL